MINFDDAIVFDFFKLPHKIKRSNARDDFYNWMFWQQSFTNCPNAVDDNGLKVGHAAFYTQLNNLISYQAFNRKTTDMYKFRLAEFNKYLATLPSEVVKRIKAAYKFKRHKAKEQLDVDLIRELVNECNQIVEASGYRFNIYEEKTTDTTSNDYEANMDNMLSALM